VSVREQWYTAVSPSVFRYSIFAVARKLPPRMPVAAGLGADNKEPEDAYVRAKIAQETLTKSFSVPCSIVSAPQFFESLQGIADFSTDGGTVRVPPVFVQPMAAEDVAGAMCRVRTGLTCEQDPRKTGSGKVSPV
jgi:hypothetical protein